MSDIETAIAQISQTPQFVRYGRVASVQGMMIEIGGVEAALAVGDRCLVTDRSGAEIAAEIVGFRAGRAQALPLGTVDGIRLGGRAALVPTAPSVAPGPSWMGRVVNGLGEPVDGKGPLDQGTVAVPLRNKPPAAHKRGRVGQKIDLGIRTLNGFLPCCRGQRMGIFAGSGVGKSVMMSMLARYTDADVAVIALIGERGREVQEFIEDDLGEEGLRRSVVVVATSDEPALVRRQAAWTAMAVAESFRDQGSHVLCMMDSLTRFAMAQREIGLSAGEPPTTKGYPPTVFGELPRLLERAGPGDRDLGGAITGLFTVLVEGDDHNEPIADAVRGILDGHIVLDRSIAERGRYPAIDVLRSVSRTLPGCNDARENAIISRARGLMATYNDMAEMIRLGAYRAGTNEAVDESIRFVPSIEDFLNQDKFDRTGIEETYTRLADILGMASEPTEDVPTGEPD
ncbi:MAG: flagellar protein export ATPase FliI [Pseudomonadota bacterium]